MFFSRTGVRDFEARCIDEITGTGVLPDLEEGRICVLTDVGDGSWLGRELTEDNTVDIPEDANVVSKDSFLL